MPELPDVEFMRREIMPYALGRRIEGVEVVDRAFVGFSQRRARAELVGRTIIGAERRGKYLLLALDSGRTLVFHMGMTGRLAAEPADAPTDRLLRLRIALEGGMELRYACLRKLGLIELVEEDDLSRIPGLARLGVEPLSGDFTLQRLKEIAGSYRGSIKALLMDQRRIAGIGNIFSDEALFKAGVHPAARAHRLSGARLARLHASLPDVLREATDRLPELHRERSWLITHRRDGEACPQCGGVISRVRLVGRSSYFCRRCQRR